MGSITAIKGQTLNIDLLEDSRDNGWIISGAKAIHNGCNQGYIELLNADYTVGVPNVFEFIVSGYSSGSVNIKVGSTSGTSRTANGTYPQTFTPVLNDKVMFYSDGNLTVEVLRIYPVAEESNGVTVGFDEKNNKWVSYYSYEPEMMINALNSFFTNKNGGMWKHGENNITNSFYGTAYPSRIIFVFNAEVQKNKLMYNFRLDSKGSWYCPNMETDKNDQFPNGMKSRLKKNNFKLQDGKLRADILRDITDPKFATIINPTQRELEALFKARKLQCSYMAVELANDDEGQAKLSSVEVYYIEAERNF